MNIKMKINLATDKGTARTRTKTLIRSCLIEFVLESLASICHFAKLFLSSKFCEIFTSEILRIFHNLRQLRGLTFPPYSRI